MTVKNATESERKVCVKIWAANNLIFGLKEQDEESYTTTYYKKIQNNVNMAESVAEVVVPANKTVSFEFTTLLGGGEGGLNHSIVVE